MKLKELYENVDNFQLKKSDNKNTNDEEGIIYEDDHYMYYYVILPLLLPSPSSILAEANVVLDDVFFDRMNTDGENNTDIIIEFLEYLRGFDIKINTKIKIKDIIESIKYNHGGYTSWFIPSEKQINDIVLDNLVIKRGRVLSSNILYENNKIKFKYHFINGYVSIDNLPIKKESTLLGQILLMRHK